MLPETIVFSPIVSWEEKLNFVFSGDVETVQRYVNIGCEIVQTCFSLY